QSLIHFFFQAEDGIRDFHVTGVQTCALPIFMHDLRVRAAGLLAVTAVVTVLAATGVLPRWSGLIHLVALPPLDLIADLRVLAAEIGRASCRERAESQVGEGGLRK